MHITNIEYKTKNKINIYINEECLFQLYPKDIELYNLVIGEELSYEKYTRILEDTLLPRAKKKAFNILKHMDNTEFELRRKLKNAFYPQEVIEATIEFLLEYNYLDDEMYAYNYIKYRKNSRSWRFLKNKLHTKGINREILDRLYIQEYLDSDEDPELIAIKKEIDKKNKDLDDLPYKEKEKLMASLYRKGFDLEKIKSFF